MEMVKLKCSCSVSYSGKKFLFILHAFRFAVRMIKFKSFLCFKALSLPLLIFAPFCCSNSPLRCMDPLSCFSVNFSKGDNFCDFLCASLVDKSLPKQGTCLKERIFSQ